MDGQLRVFTESKHEKLYSNLKSLGVVSDAHDLFFVCAALGFSRGEPRRLTRRDERFWSRTITPAEWSCYYAMVLTRHEFDVAAIRDDKSVLSEIEEFANAGMYLLVDELLGDFLVPSKNGDSPLQISAAPNGELPKDFLYYVFEQGRQ